MSLKTDTAYNLLGNGIPLLAAVLTIPYLLAKLGNEGFGLLALIWALIGYFGIFDLGVGRALTYEVSRRLKVDSNDEISRTIKAGLVLTVVTGMLGAMFIYLVVAPQCANWFKIAPGLRVDARLAFEIVALGIIPTTLTSGLRGALEGFGRFLESNINRVALGTLMFVLPAAAVWGQGSELKEIALYLVIARYLVCALALFQLRHHVFSSVVSRLSDVKPLVNFGIWVTASGLISPLMVYGDRFLVSAAVGAQALPLYAIPQEGLQRLLIMPVALTGALFPRIAVMGRGQSLSYAYRKNIKVIALVMFFVCLSAALVAYPVLSIWITRDFSEQTIPLVWVLCAGIWFNSIAQLPYAVLHARGEPRSVALIHCTELLIYFFLIYVLTIHFGVFGAAVAFTIRTAADLLFLHTAVQRHISRKGL